MSIFRELRRLLRPPRIEAVALAPVGWLVRIHGRLEPVLAWGIDERGIAVGLVARRLGLRPAAGRGFGGYMPAAPLSASDLQESPPPVTTAPRDLEEAIGDVPNPWTQDAQTALFHRLRAAADAEWASRALVAWLDDPERFLRRYFELIAEHGRPAELDDEWRAGLAAITEPRARAEAGRQGEAS